MYTSENQTYKNARNQGNLTKITSELHVKSYKFHEKIAMPFVLGKNVRNAFLLNI